MALMMMMVVARMNLLHLMTTTYLIQSMKRLHPKLLSQKPQTRIQILNQSRCHILNRSRPSWELHRLILNQMLVLS